MALEILPPPPAQRFGMRDPPPRRRRERRGGGGGFAHFVEHPAAVDNQSAAGIESAAGAFAERAIEGAHRNVVGQQYTAKPDLTANYGVDQMPGKGRRRGF